MVPAQIEWIIRSVGESERTYTVPCPVCRQGARFTVHLVVHAHPSQASESKASSTVTFRFKCLRGCKPLPVELRELWSTVTSGGKAKPDTA